MPMPVYEFSARSVDPEKALIYAKEKWVKDGGAPKQFLKSYTNSWRHIGVQFDDHLKAFAEEYEVRYVLKPKTDMPPLPLFVRIQRVGDYASARRYVEGLTAFHVKELGQKRSMKRISFDAEGLRYRDAKQLSDEKLKDLVESTQEKMHKGKDQSRSDIKPNDNWPSTRFEFLRKYSDDSRSLDSNWHFLGAPIGHALVRQEEESKYKNFTILLKEKLLDIQHRTRATAMPFAVGAYSPPSWSTVIGDFHHAAGVGVESTLTKPTTARETLVAVADSIIDSLANRFGTQLWVYSQDERSLELAIQVYRHPEDLFPDAFFGNGTAPWW